MSVNEITQIISTLGFPIAVCFICFWFINKTLLPVKSAIEVLVNTMQSISTIVDNLNITMKTIQVKLEEKE